MSSTSSQASRLMVLVMRSKIELQQVNVVDIQNVELRNKKYGQIEQKHTTGGIPRWSPTLVLVARFSAYVWQSGRDAQFSLTYGRMC